MRQAPRNIRELSLTELIAFLAKEYLVTVDTVSWGDTLLFASFLSSTSSSTSTSTSRPLDRPLLQVALRALAAELPVEQAMAQLKARLRGKAFVLLRVSGSCQLEIGGEISSDIAISPIKIWV